MSTPPPLLEADMRSAVLANHYLVKAANLLRYYSFDLTVRDVELQLYDWLITYPAPWIPAAVIEALYQGRYKAVSVEQILLFWQRRQQPQPLYGRDFEQLVCDRLPQRLPSDPAAPLEVAPEKSAIAALAAQIRQVSPELTPLEALSRAIQKAIPIQRSVDAVVDQAEARLGQASDQGKRQVMGEGRSEEEAVETTAKSSTVIPQFTPQTSGTDLHSKLKEYLSP
ncbi:MAG: hypothetical protein HC860_07565 [Alkalinema sp. RU_4_3]|nr:hypothetical protein [Alkalinema sp. RU_4_3]